MMTLSQARTSAFGLANPVKCPEPTINILTSQLQVAVPPSQYTIFKEQRTLRTP